MTTIEEICLILGVGLAAPLVLVYSITRIPRFINTSEGIGHVLINALGYSTFLFIMGWPHVFFNEWNDGQYDDWAFLIGILYIAVPAGMLFWFAWLFEKDSQAHAVATSLCLEAETFINKEMNEVAGADYESIFPLENEQFIVISTDRGFSWYSKIYDVWFFRNGGVIYHCDSDQNVLCQISRHSHHHLNLKKYLIQDRQLQSVKTLV